MPRQNLGYGYLPMKLPGYLLNLQDNFIVKEMISHQRLYQTLTQEDIEMTNEHMQEKLVQGNSSSFL
jgi:hypothetical protein